VAAILNVCAYALQLTDLSIQYLCGVCHYLAYLDISGSLHISYVYALFQFLKM